MHNLAILLALALTPIRCRQATVRLDFKNAICSAQGCCNLYNAKASPRDTHLGTSSLAMPPKPTISTDFPYRVFPRGTPTLPCWMDAAMADADLRQASARYSAISAQDSALPVPSLGMLLTWMPLAVACILGGCDQPQAQAWAARKLHDCSLSPLAGQTVDSTPLPVVRSLLMPLCETHGTDYPGVVKQHQKGQPCTGGLQPGEMAWKVGVKRRTAGMSTPSTPTPYCRMTFRWCAFSSMAASSLAIKGTAMCALLSSFPTSSLRHCRTCRQGVLYAQALTSGARAPDCRPDYPVSGKCISQLRRHCYQHATMIEGGVLTPEETQVDMVLHSEQRLFFWHFDASKRAVKAVLIEKERMP